MNFNFTKNVFAAATLFIGLTTANTQAQNDILSPLKALSSFQTENSMVSPFDYKNIAPTGHKSAAAPANDDCASATLITAGVACSPTTGTFAAATQSIPADSCAGLQTVPTAFDVWYTFTATASNQTIQVTPEAQAAAVVVLYNTCGGSPITCANPTNFGVATSLKATLIIGNTYKVRVYPYSATIPANSGFTICVFNTPAPPANDECSGAITITESASAAACSPTTVNTVGATKSADVAICSNISIDDDVWYSFTATSVNVTVKASNKSFTGGVGFVLYTSVCGGVQSSECEFNAAGDSITFRSLTIGTVYKLRTFSNGTVNFGTYNICLYPFTPPPPPANDDCANAITLVSGTSCVTTNGTYAEATQSAPADSCTGSQTVPTAFDVWYKFTATSANQTITVASNAQARVRIALYASCGSTPINCAFPAGFGAPTTLKATGLTVGTTYIIRTYPFSVTIPTDPKFTVCVFSTPNPPANDDCANATSITPALNKASSTFSNTSNTVGANQDRAPSCASASSDDNVWFKFTANSTTMTFLADVTTFSGFTSVGASLFEGSCSGVEKGCSASTNPTGDSLAFDSLTIGTVYYLTTFTQGTTARGTYKFKVYGSGSTVGISDLNVSLNNLSIYPNPSKGLFNLSFSTTVEKSTITVYDVIGSIVKQETISTNGNVNYPLDLTNQANGTYFVKTQSGDGFSIKKITINK